MSGPKCAVPRTQQVNRADTLVELARSQLGARETQQRRAELRMQQQAARDRATGFIQAARSNLGARDAGQSGVTSAMPPSPRVDLSDEEAALSTASAKFRSAQQAAAMADGVDGTPPPARWVDAVGNASPAAPAMTAAGAQLLATSAPLRSADSLPAAGDSGSAQDAAAAARTAVLARTALAERADMPDAEMDVSLAEAGSAGTPDPAAATSDVRQDPRFQPVTVDPSAFRVPVQNIVRGAATDSAPAARPDAPGIVVDRSDGRGRIRLKAHFEVPALGGHEMAVFEMRLPDGTLAPLVAVDDALLDEEGRWRNPAYQAAFDAYVDEAIRVDGASAARTRAVAGEDAPTARELMGALGREGYRTDEATTGAQTHHRVRRAPRGKTAPAKKSAAKKARAAGTKAAR